MTSTATEAYYFSGMGKRSNNEDACYPSNPALDESVFIVCDGVGGHANGEVASNLCCKLAAELLKTKKEISPEIIVDVFANVHKELLNYAAKNSGSDNMATTAACVVFMQNLAWVAHIGDSRVYHIRDGKAIFRTTDHSLVGEMVLQKIITEAEARLHAKKNVITRALSVNRSYQHPDIHKIYNLQAGDYFLLCTDGFLEAFTDAEIEDIVANNSTVAEKVTFMEWKCSSISKDNNTAYLIKIIPT